MSKNTKEDYLGMLTSFLLIGTVFITIFLVNKEQEKERLQEDREKALIEECLYSMNKYCKGREEKGEITSKQCPLVKDSAYLWGYYTCKKTLYELYLSSGNFTYKFLNGEGKYEFRAF